MRFLPRILSIVGVAALLVLFPGCGGKREVTMELTRETVIASPGIQSLRFEPSDRVDTRESPQSVSVVLRGDSGLVASFDVEGRFEARSMEETSPGVYSGSFVVAQGQIGELQAVGHLLHPPTGANADIRGSRPLTLYESVIPEDCSERMAAAFDADLQNLKLPFEFDGIVLTDESRSQLDAATGVLQTNPYCTIYVLGHADAVGGEHYNFVLSTYRTLAVVNRLIELGIPRDRMEPHFFGEEEPLVPGDSDADRARNRRVELRAVNPY
jgi:outer membrane protein OmpA-like peptidoglycan-associated protein